MKSSYQDIPASSNPGLSRRRFLTTTSTAIVGGSLLEALAPERAAFASSTDTIKIALVGCGGRSAKIIDPYQQEHDNLFAAIRNNTPYHEAEHGATRTMTGILGRMCTYSGQQIEWEDAFNSQIELLPKTFSCDALPLVLPDDQGFYPIAVPGKTRCV